MAITNLRAMNKFKNRYDIMMRNNIRAIHSCQQYINIILNLDSIS